MLLVIHVPAGLQSRCAPVLNPERLPSELRNPVVFVKDFGTPPETNQTNAFVLFNSESEVWVSPHLDRGPQFGRSQLKQLSLQSGATLTHPFAISVINQQQTVHLPLEIIEWWISIASFDYRRLRIFPPT